MGQGWTRYWLYLMYSSRKILLLTVEDYLQQRNGSCHNQYDITTPLPCTHWQDKISLQNTAQRTPQGSVIAPALFNLYTFDIPDTISSKYIYADDIALLKSDTDFPDIEAVLSKDLDNLREYFFQWRLKLNRCISPFKS